MGGGFSQHGSLFGELVPVELRNEASFSMQLVNRVNVPFKVKASPKKYYVCPDLGIVAHERACDIAVLLRKCTHCKYVKCLKGLSGDADGSAENELDEQALQADLQVAIRSENYARAAKLRDELHLLQEDNRAGVIAANAKFYKAFELGDVKSMRTIWAKGENVHCIHPGAGCISGYDLVMASWQVMLGPELTLPLRIDLENLEVHVKGNLAFVTCVEVVRTSGSSWGKQVATNIFEKQNGNWLICVHHASHIIT
eukprot:c12870_g1_i2 orf=308-1072(-)